MRVKKVKRTFDSFSVKCEGPASTAVGIIPSLYCWGTSNKWECREGSECRKSFSLQTISSITACYNVEWGPTRVIGIVVADSRREARGWRSGKGSAGEGSSEGNEDRELHDWMRCCNGWEVVLRWDEDIYQWSQFLYPARAKRQEKPGTEAIVNSSGSGSSEWSPDREWVRKARK